jgi:hypothetical protein
VEKVGKIFHSNQNEFLSSQDSAAAWL